MSETISRRGFALGTLAGLTVLATMAGTVTAQAADPAAQRIQSYYSSLLPIVQASHGQSVAERARRISGSIMGAFDIGSMTRLAVGPEWSRFSPAQQSAVRDAFGKFIVASYASQMDSYGGENYTVNPVSQPRGGDRIVQTTIGTTTINYLVRGGRIVDIYYNGTVSDMANRRAEFSSVIASGGPDGLIQSLRQRTQQILGG
jgi:phospholipid transport system substrate-binding protein